jgi:hypothetical protein
LGRSGCRRIARGEIFIDLLLDCPELTLLELGDPDPAPAFGGANERGIHQLQDRTLAKGMRDDFGAAALLTEQPFQQIGGADRAAVAERETQLRDARLEVVVETSHGPTADPWRRSMQCRRAAGAPVLARPPGKTPRHGP